MPPTRPCCWLAATPTSARLRLDARTLIRISLGAGAGLGMSRTSAPFSPTTAALMMVLLQFEQHLGGPAKHFGPVGSVEPDLVGQVNPPLLERDHHRGIGT